MTMRETQFTDDTRANPANACITYLALLAGMAVFTALILLAVWLPEWAVTTWAVLATVLIPITALLGWRFGYRDVNLTQSGVHLGIETVMGAAERATQFRGRAGYTEGQHKALIEQQLQRRLDPEMEIASPQVLLIEPGQSDGQDIMDL